MGAGGVGTPGEGRELGEGLELLYVIMNVVSQMSMSKEI